MNRLNFHRLVLWAMLLLFAAWFLVPLYVMLTTSLKDAEQLRAGHLLTLPTAPTLAQPSSSSQAMTAPRSRLSNLASRASCSGGTRRGCAAGGLRLVAAVRAAADGAGVMAPGRFLFSKKSATVQIKERTLGRPI